MSRYLDQYNLAKIIQNVHHVHRIGEQSPNVCFIHSANGGQKVEGERREGGGNLTGSILAPMSARLLVDSGLVPVWIVCKDPYGSRQSLDPGWISWVLMQSDTSETQTYSPLVRSSIFDC